MSVSISPYSVVRMCATPPNVTNIAEYGSDHLNDRDNSFVLSVIYAIGFPIVKLYRSFCMDGKEQKQSDLEAIRSVIQRKLNVNVFKTEFTMGHNFADGYRELVFKQDDNTIQIKSTHGEIFGVVQGTFKDLQATLTRGQITQESQPVAKPHLFERLDSDDRWFGEATNEILRASVLRRSLANSVTH